MKLLINILLSIIAIFSVWILGIPLYLSGLLLSFSGSVYHKRIAIVFDQVGNVLGGPLFNLILKKIGGYKFGNEDDTISMCLAINERVKNLTEFGKFFANMLEALDPGHLEKAIEKCKHSSNTY
jgi:hypothetical protein